MVLLEWIPWRNSNPKGGGRCLPRNCLGEVLQGVVWRGAAVPERELARLLHDWASVEISLKLESRKMVGV